MFVRRCTAALALALALILSACGAGATAPTRAPDAPTAAPTVAPPTPVPTAAPTQAAACVTCTDAAGRKVTIATPPERLISLAPSNTEILYALGLASKLVAVDDFTDYPAEAKNLPKIGGLNAAYNFEQIVALKPDLIFASGITPPE